MVEHNVCRVCNAQLVVGENITQHRIDRRDYRCQRCQNEYLKTWKETHPGHLREWSHRTKRCKSMSENRECPSFLGVHVAEQVLALTFKNVQRMPYGNPGYDFICGRGYEIDVKASCRRHSKKQADQWTFTIKKNKIADYFLCLAFDNRNNLNPEHIWLIPANDVNDHVIVGISETTLSKWDKYVLDIKQVTTCCNAIR